MKHIVFDCDGTLVDTRGPKYKLFPGIKELLSELARENKLYVWTARGRASTLRILKELEVIQFFEGFSTPDDHPPKPYIDGLQDLVGTFSKKSICVIGDSTNDILGAKNFGVLSLGATWYSGTNPGILQDAGADFIVSHPSECSSIIRQNLERDSHV